MAMAPPVRAKARLVARNQRPSVVTSSNGLQSTYEKRPGIRFRAGRSTSWYVAAENRRSSSGLAPLGDGTKAAVLRVKPAVRPRSPRVSNHRAEAAIVVITASKTRFAEFGSAGGSELLSHKKSGKTCCIACMLDVGPREAFFQLYLCHRWRYSTLGLYHQRLHGFEGGVELVDAWHSREILGRLLTEAHTIYICHACIHIYLHLGGPYLKACDVGVQYAGAVAEGSAQRLLVHIHLVGVGGG